MVASSLGAMARTNQGQPPQETEIGVGNDTIRIGVIRRSLRGPLLDRWTIDAKRAP